RAFAEACGGRLEGADRAYSGVSTDTRSLESGALFIALRGPRFNGYEFLAAAAAAGAAGAVIEEASAGDRNVGSSLARIIVPDTQAALSRAASAWRAQFDMPLVGVAGSNGKTTVKEMTAAILAQAGSCLATRGNLNNHIGVPLTLLRLEPEHRFAVIETGANRAGEVASLAALARPTIGLITNAGAEHLEGFGSLEGVARAEGEMVESLAPEAIAVINADDEFAPLWRSLTRARIVTFGLTARVDFTAREVRTDIAKGEFRTRFTLESVRGRTLIELKLAGRHNIANALCAAAAATAAGASLEHVRAGLAAMRAVQGRLQLKRARCGAWVIDDSYNANPSSVRAGIDVLAELEGPKWLVLGEMAELGEFARPSHAEIGAYARDRGVGRLCATGELTQLAVESFGTGAEWYPDTEALARALDTALPREAAVLIKGSRVNRLERVVAALTGPGK
ncbi:MAG TPA: UDP-N-acetylmuramoyl-tripeptide--D-alanyl-D-alanine ligase, partial [Steroidobacteraceae bacterium]|nr:UDP-N-acetylmuramoyl-tripeptide--D-alanyl-D-alanine ligase [Steroidobacteraceae bacterium]